MTKRARAGQSGEGEKQEEREDGDLPGHANKYRPSGRHPEHLREGGVRRRYGPWGAGTAFALALTFTMASAAAAIPIARHVHHSAVRLRS